MGSSIICPACEGENREGARFCRHCGFELAAAAVEDLAPAADSEKAPEDAGLEALEPEEEEPLEVPEAGEPEVGAMEEGEPDTRPEWEEPVDEPELQIDEPLGETSGEESDSGAEALPWPAAEEETGEPPVAPEAEDDVLLFWREEPESLQPLEQGMVVADRYRLLETLDVQPSQILYEAEDLRACWQCGFEGNAVKDAFCSQCGAALTTRPEVRLLQVASGEGRPESEAELGDPVEHEGQLFFPLRQPAVAAEPLAQELRLVVGHRSDTGRVRELDEDSLLVISLAPSYKARTSPVLGLYAVADGMGGHEGGEIASKLALQVLAEHVLKGIMLPELAGDTSPEQELLVRLQAGIAAANDAVYLARHKRGNDMGTTLTAILVRDDRLIVGHVGDCRAYRWNAEGLEQLTTDHSVVASMIANGKAAPEEIYSHPHRSVIYRSIGDKPSVEVDAAILPLAAGDRLVVCSDGLWEMVRNEGIADVMLQEADPQAACDLLVRHANLAGGEDNISIVIVSVGAT
jgi:serine/threonine protein phosphatase PrpC